MDYFWVGVSIVLAGVAMGREAVNVAWMITRGVIAVVGVGLFIGVPLLGTEGIPWTPSWFAEVLYKEPSRRRCDVRGSRR